MILKNSLQVCAYEERERKKALLTITETSIIMKEWEIFFHKYKMNKTYLEGFPSIFSYLGRKKEREK